MVPIRDIVPQGCEIAGMQWGLQRTDIDDPLDCPVLLHRKVAMPCNTHVRGPTCLCSPVIATEGEVASASFRDKPDYLGVPN
jgi:hypothetical protein